jgi:predicted O-methyltransferase YrrM
MGRSAAETQSALCELLERIYDTGKVETAEGEQRTAEPVGVPRAHALRLAELVRTEGLESTLETGLAYGLSALAVAGVHAARSSGSHIAIDPVANTYYEGIAVVNLRRAGLSDRVRVMAEPSQAALPRLHAEGLLIDFAFIDGMHLAEYALRDVINTERFTHAASVIVIDDMLPRHVDEAGRGREAGARRGAWAGDVYKMIDAFRELRPDLVCLEVDTKPTGTVVLLLPDPSSTALPEAYDRLVAEFVVPDPQKVPDAILGRTRALNPETLLESPVWGQLRRLRELPDAQARPAVRSLLNEAGLRTDRS